MPNNEFDLQDHLIEMERRIREDIRAIAVTATVAKENTLALSGRVANLEEKAGWIGAGFGAGFIGMCAFVWHIVASYKIRP